MSKPVVSGVSEELRKKVEFAVGQMLRNEIVSIGKIKAIQELLAIADSHSWVEGPPTEKGLTAWEDGEGQFHAANIIILEGRLYGGVPSSGISIAHAIRHFRIPTPPKREPVVDCCMRAW